MRGREGRDVSGIKGGKEKRREFMKQKKGRNRIRRSDGIEEREEKEKGSWDNELYFYLIY